MASCIKSRYALGFGRVSESRLLVRRMASNSYTAERWLETARSLRKLP